MRANQQPQDWDLAMQLVRDDLDHEPAALESQFPGRTTRVRAARAAGRTPMSSAAVVTPRARGCQRS